MKRTIIILALGCAMAANAQTYTLEQIIDSALQNNIAIRNARHDIEAARQQRKEAFTRYFPEVSGSGGWFNASKDLLQTDLMGMSLSMLKDGVMAGVNAVQPVFAGGQIVNGNKLARVSEDASRLQLRLSRNEVAKTAEQYYWQLVSLQEKMNTLAAIERLLADLNKDATVAMKAGVALHNDLLQVQLRQNEVESQRLKLQNGLALARMLLAQYCGLRDTSFAVQPQPSSPSEEAAPTLADHEQALPATAEYQLLQKQVEASSLQYKMEIGKSLPSVGVGVGYSYSNLLDKDVTRGMVFATVSVPISGWWGGSHAIRRKRIERQKAIDQLADNAELLTIRMQKAYNDVAEARQQLALARRSIEQAEENLRLNRDYYRAGTVTMSDLLEAQLLYQQTLDKRTDAYADMQEKMLAYRQAIGQ